ncbi:MAG: aromatic amino acid ammonia-lyase, partial [candidate division WOR-3 bacterium]|nr:aromatic amino acid ammonia-lyase [candidate division WOR-3 bacterium]
MHSQGPIVVDGHSLTKEQIIAVARGNAKVVLDEETRSKLQTLWEEFQKAVEEKIEEANVLALQHKEGSLSKKEFGIKLKQKMIYGVTTGFGAMKTAYAKTQEDAKKLQKNLILSHSSGVGERLNGETVRAAMLLRANTLASGYCGVRLQVVDRLIDLLNNDILPVVPAQGSVGASGDLAPLAHLALGIIGEGPITYKGEEFYCLEALKGKYPNEFDNIPSTFDLSYKEGLALINGTTVMTAIATLAYWDAKHLLDWADSIGAITLDALLGSTRAFDEVVYTVYHHEGAKESARNILSMVQGSFLVNQYDSVHDPYSLRCIPQLHGSARDALDFIGKQLDRHLNSVTDDPLFFSLGEVSSHPPFDGLNDRYCFEEGHFHGAPIGHIMDLLSIIIADLGAMSERRTQMLLDENHNRGLPSCLIDNPDNINSGYMIAQYTAAALVSENKSLSHPASVDSVPTSANTEDHVSMGMIAARKARKVVDNVYNVFGIELLCSTEALSY